MTTPKLVHRSAATWATAACAIGLYACKDRPAATGATDAGAATTAVEQPAQPKTLPYEQRFTVLAPGAEPRAILRYELADATYETQTDLTVRAKTYATGAGWSKPLDLAFVEHWTWSLTKTGAQGLVVGVPVSVAGTSKQPGAATRLEPTLSLWQSALQGKAFTAAVSERGYLGNVSFDHDKLASSPATQFAIDEVKQRWLGYVVPLPDVPVGQGAKWQVVTTVRIGGIMMTQTADYALTKLSADAWTFDVVSERNADKQPLNAADVPAGVTAELMGAFRKVTMTLTVAKAWPWPTIDGGRLEMERHQRQLPPGEFADWQETISRDEGSFRTKANVAATKPRGGPPGPPPAAPPGTAASKNDSNTATGNSPP